MANETGDTNKKSVKDIFESMDYEHSEENYDLAKTWIAKLQVKIPNNVEEINAAIQKTETQFSTWSNTSGIERAKLINKLAAEIERHSALICQLESLIRHNLMKDTKNKSIPLLTEYLRYYAGWSQQLHKKFPDYKPYGVCVHYLGKEISLATFGAVLAPVLAAGNTLIFVAYQGEVLTASLIVELCKNVGFPEGILSVIRKSNSDHLFTSKNVKKIIYTDNIYDANISNKEISETKFFTALHPGKSTSVVFDSADLDSACDSITESAWSCKSVFTSGINKVLVQETIFKEFVDKFEAKIDKLNIDTTGAKHLKTTDIALKVQDLTLDEKVEIVNGLPLKIGYKSFGTNVVQKDQSGTEILSVLPFRTANEAVALANNNRCRLSVSIWTENISLASEVTAKLKANIVWINNHGVTNPNASISVNKGSGRGFFGGKEGLLEYLKFSKAAEFKTVPEKQVPSENHLPHTAQNKRTYLYYGGAFKKSESGLTNLDEELPNKKDVRNCVEIAKKNYEAWNKLLPKVRGQHLWKLADASESIKTANAAIKEKWVDFLRDWATECNSIQSLVQPGNPELKIWKEPLGVIAIEFHSDPSFGSLNLIAAAFACGNAVIILNCSDEAKEFLGEICKILSASGISPGIFNVIFNPNIEVMNALKAHREVDTYLLPYFGSSSQNLVTFKQMLCENVFGIVNTNSNEDILKLVTQNKCVLSSNGDSFL